MTDNRTTELLRKMLDERGIKWKNVGGTTSGDGITEWLVDGMTCQAAQRVTVGIEHLALCIPVLTPEQAIAATLGDKKAKVHPYGYEPDTGAFDVTRCECGCLNDISATYCNDCGGIIEVDMDAEKEIYKYSPRNSVFATKHDDGSLEFGGKRYVAATLRGTLTAEQVRDTVEKHWYDLSADYDMPEASALPEYSYDWQAIADELNATLGGGECEWVLREKWPNRTGDDHVYGYETGCGARHTWWPDSLPNYCPNCGKAVKR